jgi:branched-chain amino acid transport system permease protein
LGGAGTVSGPIVGAIILTFVPELLRFLQEYYMALFGIVIVLFMLFIPQGLVSLFAADGKFAGWLADRGLLSKHGGPC